ncbi:MAG: nuclear transport factor 2 family protein [Candidatus Sulfotelmatobacter sp.]
MYTNRTPKKSGRRRKTLVESDEQQIVKLFEDGDRALIAADLAELSRIFADDYVQYDETGRASTKRDVLNNLKSGAIRYVSMISTGRHIRLLSRETAIVHGSEEDESSKLASAAPSATFTWTRS